MTSRARISAVCRSVEYVVSNSIPGDIVECGVWRGDSMTAAALRLKQLESNERTLYLFDAFSGTTPETEEDRGRPPMEVFDDHPYEGGWCESPLELVQHNMFSTGYDREKIVFVEGPVQETITESAPEGFEVQIEEYAKAERTDATVFLVIQVTTTRNSIDRLEAAQGEALRAGKRTPEIKVVDGRIKDSASHLEADEE